MKKICIITGSRAEYGLLRGIMMRIKQDPGLQLQVLATNMHLAPEYGLTYKEIEADGFHIDQKVHMLISSDTPNATTKSVGLGMIGFADAYENLRPDMIVVLGDRFEILAAASAALFYHIPVVHIHGGEITEGAYDDAIRHAITKLSHLHFTSTEEYRKRVIQMGENPQNVHYVGAVGCDNIRELRLMNKEGAEASVDFKLDRKTVLVTYHPVTMEENTAEDQFKNLLSALSSFPELRVIFTYPNSDTGGSVIRQMIQDYVRENPERSTFFPSLGVVRYLSVLQFIGGVVGNSSSGIVEVPSFGIPTINIGDRQKGRIYADSVWQCSPDTQEIMRQLANVLKVSAELPFKDVINPYDKPGTAQAIVDGIKSHPLTHYKRFYDLPQS